MAYKSDWEKVLHFHRVPVLLLRGWCLLPLLILRYSLEEEDQVRALITNLPLTGETLKKRMEKRIATMAFPNKILKKACHVSWYDNLSKILNNARHLYLKSSQWHTTPPRMRWIPWWNQMVMVQIIISSSNFGARIPGTWTLGLSKKRF